MEASAAPHALGKSVNNRLRAGISALPFNNLKRAREGEPRLNHSAKIARKEYFVVEREGTPERPEKLVQQFSLLRDRFDEYRRESLHAQHPRESERILRVPFAIDLLTSTVCCSE